jgi:hypothetical protein
MLDTALNTTLRVGAHHQDLLNSNKYHHPHHINGVAVIMFSLQQLLRDMEVMVSINDFKQNITKIFSFLP